VRALGERLVVNHARWQIAASRVVYVYCTARIKAGSNSPVPALASPGAVRT
jgi:hypothetical protein